MATTERDLGVIYGDTVKALRNKVNLSQERLAHAAKLGVATVKRIERSGADGHRANGRVINALAAALRTGPDALAKPARSLESKDLNAQGGYSRVVLDLESHAAMSLYMVEAIYGITVRTQFTMAPLFAALLAEGSLNWRRARVDQVKESVAQIGRLSFNQAGIYIGADRIDSAAAAEEASIEKRDIFGKIAADHSWDEYSVADDPQRNPFAEYLRSLAKGVADSPISLETEEDLFYATDGTLTYEVGRTVFDALTGGDSLASLAVREGHARLADIPKDLLKPASMKERVAWLAARVPAEARARQEQLDREFDELLKSL